MTSLIPISLFLKAGFISVAVIWFFALCVFNYAHSNKRYSKNYYINLLPIIFFGLHVIWIFFAENKNEAIDIVIKKIHLILLPLGFIIVNKKITSKNLNIILTIFLISCIACSFICLINAVYNAIRFGSLIYETAGRDYYYFTSYPLTSIINIEPIYLSLYYTFAYLTLLTIPLINNKPLKTIIAIYIAVFIILISSKTGILCVAIVTLICLLTSVDKKLKYYSVVGIVTITFIVFYIYSSNLSKERFLAFFEFDYLHENGEISGESANHASIWAMSLETINQSPFLGYGTGDGQHALEETFKKHGFEIGVRDSLNSHNEFLTTFLEFGIIGLGVLIVMMILPMIRALIAKNIFMTCFIFIMCIFFFAESFLVRQKGIVFFSFFYSLVFCGLVADKQEIVEGDKNFDRRKKLS